MSAEVLQMKAAARFAAVSDYDYEDFFENGAIGLHFVDGDGIIRRANKAELEMMGYTAEEYVGRRIADFHADPEIIDDILRRLSAGERLDKYPARLKAKDGSIKHVLISSSVLFRDGEFINSRCFSVDVTAFHSAETAREDAERRSRELLDALPMAVYTTDADGRITYYNEAAALFAGRRPELGVDQWCVTWKLYWPDGAPLAHDQCPMAFALKNGEELRGVEAVAERPDGTRRFFSPFPTVLRDNAGKVVGGINVLVDITDRKKADEAQRLLIDELNHRVKNTLATVQSISLQTHRSTPEDFVARFEDRLIALSKAHDLLTRRRWAGVGLSELLEQGLAPYSDLDNPRMLLDGPELTLSSRAGLALGMILHELATNAAKYGALSSPHGRVDVSWSISETKENQKQFALRWIEKGGPKVDEPSRRGFGRKLIERTITQDLGGKAVLKFEPTGVQCHISFALT